MNRGRCNTCEVITIAVKPILHGVTYFNIMATNTCYDIGDKPLPNSDDNLARFLSGKFSSSRLKSSLVVLPF